MVQWVASPLNQSYFPMTKKSGEREKGEGKIPWTAEETEDNTNLVILKIYPLKIMGKDAYLYICVQSLQDVVPEYVGVRREPSGLHLSSASPVAS